MKIGLLGAGNMGGALLRAIASLGEHDIVVFDPVKTIADFDGIGDKVRFSAAESEAVKGSDLLIVALKPAVIDNVCKKIAGDIDVTKTVVLSVAAGVKTSLYEQYFGDVRIIRTMPNIPALCGKGYTGIYFKNVDDQAMKDSVLRIFNSMGETGVFNNEDMIDRLIPVTSSSPAYICMLIEAMADGAVKLGFQRAEAYKMCEQAVLGTAEYLKETGMHPAEMKDRVCSPAGTTIEAVLALEENGFRNSILKAMDKCYAKIK
ncbi:MAG: pyrroline-5-carboxylate reductase [Clostridia bacterium]|nr:pyrroline-5-carboxylate reductase [Clostridia bacterium]